MILQEQGRELNLIKPRGPGVELPSVFCHFVPLFFLFPFPTFPSNHVGSCVKNDVACHFQEVRSNKVRGLGPPRMAGLT